MYKKMKLVLMEENLEQRVALRMLLEFYNVFEVVGEFSDVNEANEYICTNEVDVVFINLEVGNPAYIGDGSYLAYNIAQRRPDTLIVVYSGRERTASDIFDLQCTEYFELPFDSQVMQRVVSRVSHLYELLLCKKETMNRSVMIKTKSGYQLIFVADILFIERSNRRNHLITADGKDILLSGYSLDELERILSGHGFFYRSYQSFLVNLARVSYIKADNEKKYFTLAFEDYAGEVMLSRDKYTEVVQLLKNRYARITL